jgi:DNA-binding MarR family transcriptional regulator
MGGASGGYESFFSSQNELHDLFTRAIDGMLRPEGITVMQAFTLKAVQEQGGRCRMSDLAATRLHTPAAMTGIVDRLIHLELVVRESDLRDRRVILLSLTDRGTTIVTSIQKKIEDMMRRFFESMPKADRETTMRVLTRLTDFFKEEINATKKG